MSYVESRNLTNQNYILTNENSFFLRFCDSGFKNKWCGFWVEDQKFLEYFAFKINDEWLSPFTCKKFYLNLNEGIHIYELNNLEVEERITLLKGFPALLCKLSFFNQSEEKSIVNLLGEIAFNIRKGNEGWHDRKYEYFYSNYLLVKNELGAIALKTFPSINFEPNAFYKDHYPSNEKQRCFLPGDFKYIFELEPNTKKEISFLFIANENFSLVKKWVEELNEESFLLSDLNLLSYQKVVEDAYFESNFEDLNFLFKWSVLNLEKLYKKLKVGRSYLAGLPWFYQFWGRDLGWMVRALINLGFFERVKETLELLLNFEKDGQIPNFISNGGIDYNSLDATLYWLWNLEFYLRNSKDLSFFSENQEKIEKLIKFLKSRMDKDGFLVNKEFETWMDTLERTGRCVENQALWIKVLRCLARIYERFEKKRSKEFFGLAEKVEKNFLKKFWDDELEFLIDRIDEKPVRTKTINPLFAFYLLDLPFSLKLLKKFENEFETPYGIACYSLKEKEFNEMNYHKGASWGYLNEIYTACLLKLNKIEKAFQFFDLLRKASEKFCITCVPEVWNSLTGDVFLLKKDRFEETCYLQGWSCSNLINCVDEFLLGINVDFSNTIFVSPKIPPNSLFIRKKRVGNDWLTFVMKRKKETIEVDLLGKNSKKFKILKLNFE